MGYRLEYSVSGGVLMVTISGSCPTPGAIARDIGREARENAVRNVLVDVRRLQDRIGRIRDLLADKRRPEAHRDPRQRAERAPLRVRRDRRARAAAARCGASTTTSPRSVRWLGSA